MSQKPTRAYPSRVSGFRLIAPVLLLLGVATSCKASEPAPQASPKPDRAGTPVEVPEKAPTPTTPTIQELVAKYENSLGPAEVRERFERMELQGSLEAKDHRLRGTVRSYWDRGRFLIIEELEGLGRVRVGSDGTTIWSDDPIQGLRVLEGPEAAAYRREADPFMLLRWSDYFSEAKVERDDSLGEKEWRLVFRDVSGEEVRVILDEPSGRPVRVSFRQIDPTGVKKVEASYEDWRQVDGLNFAHLQRTQVEQLLTLEQRIDSVRAIEEHPQDRFVLPEQLRAVPADPSKQGPPVPPG